MNTEALTTFLSLTKTRNFTQTARNLFVAQSTITNRISELEKEVNTKLFIRTNRSVDLTPAGEQFLEYAEKMIVFTENSLSKISSSTNYSNILHIGACDSIYEGHLAPLILNYQSQNPKDALKIVIGLSTQLVDQLQNGIIDVAFTYLPLHRTQYDCALFKQDAMVLVTDYNNRNYEKGIQQKDFTSINYLMCNFAMENVGQFIRGLFPKYHQFSLEIDDCYNILPFLLNRDTYSFLPEDMVISYVNEKKLRTIPLLDFQTPVINSYIIGKQSKKKLWDYFTN